MEAFATTYGLSFPAFQALLEQPHHLVAGSAALANYLQQEEGVAGFIPNDMDIWIANDLDSCMSDFLMESGYRIVEQEESKMDDPYHQELHHIQRVFSFKHPEKQTYIQLILVRQKNLLGYIYEHFDLNVCMTWYNAATRRFQTVWPEEVTLRLLRAVHHEEHPRTRDRIQKYTERGFHVYEAPPPTNLARDEREILYQEKPWSLRNRTAFDCIQYEDRSITDFLKESPWNILLKSGDTYYAFHRKQLIDCMEKKNVSILEYGFLYDTPFNQSLNEIQLESLNYSDFTIYELMPAYSITLDQVNQKSVYDLQCYSLADREKPVCRITMYSYPIERVVSAMDSDEED